MVYEKLVEKLCSFLSNIWSNSWKKVATVPHILGFQLSPQPLAADALSPIYCPLKSMCKVFYSLELNLEVFHIGL